VWDLWPEDWRTQHSNRFKDAWFAFGGSWLLMRTHGGQRMLMTLVAGTGTPAMAPAIARVLAAKANSIPEEVRASLKRSWKNIPYSRPDEPELFVRNDWYERRELVATVRAEIDGLVPVAVRAVTRAGGDTAPLNALKGDDILHYETVDAAMAQLNRALPTSEPPQDELAKGMPALMTGRQAAQAIGISESTLSRWHKDVPAWASSNPALFRHLTDRDNALYPRSNVKKLRAWLEEGQNDGGQRPVDCP
jgi:hypothetical protein